MATHYNLGCYWFVYDGYGTWLAVATQMRNPARIYPLLNKIGDIWVKTPDLRLGQLIECIKAGGNLHPDLFNIEDDQLEVLVDKFAKNKSLVLDDITWKRGRYYKNEPILGNGY